MSWHHDPALHSQRLPESSWGVSTLDLNRCNGFSPLWDWSREFTSKPWMTTTSCYSSDISDEVMLNASESKKDTKPMLPDSRKRE